MTSARAITEYNYAMFEGKENFLAFRSVAQVGTRAPDFDVVDISTGEAGSISDRLHGRDLLIEFGSLT
jgi:hypothetical protein